MKKADTAPTNILRAPLMWRVCSFAAIFVVVAGLLGSRIVGGGMVGRYGFAVYGGAGKALLFGLLCFGLLVAKRQRTLKTETWLPRNSIWLGLCLVSLLTAELGVGKLLHGSDSAGWIVLTHAALLGSVAFAALGSFGLATIRQLMRHYSRELIVSIALGVLFVGFLYTVYGLWRVFAGIVLHSVSYLLGLSGLGVFVVPPHTLLLSKFSVDISQYCSGIDSIALFTGLYALLGVLDWQRFDHRRYLLAFLPALTLLFGLNILRVYLLILAGYYINTHIAFSLFHTYAGMLFFILYAALFWHTMYGRLLRKPY